MMTEFEKKIKEVADAERELERLQKITKSAIEAEATARAKVTMLREGIYAEVDAAVSRAKQ